MYHQDANGNVVALSGVSGSLIEKYEYLPYGGQSVYNASGVYQGKESTVGNPYMFTGRRYDDESGLYYYRARMYSSILGRFLQTDPLGYYDSMNLYQYCGNNPVNWVDPLGLGTDSLSANPGQTQALLDPEMLAHLYPKAVEVIRNTPWYIKVLIALGLYKATSGDEEEYESKDDRRNLPVKGEPDGIDSLPSKSGNGPKQIRTYNGNGDAKTDYDFQDHKDVGNPHGHDWDDGVRGPARPLKPGEENWVIEYK